MKKITLLLLTCFVIVSCGNKNKENLEENISIENEITNKQIEIKEEIPKDFREISMFNLTNEIFSATWKQNLKQKAEILRNDENLENKQKATYIESVLWNYDVALKEREELCEKEFDKKYCEKVQLELISFLPEDENENILKDVKVFVDGRENFSTDEIEPNFMHRVQYKKEGYLDYTTKFNLRDDSEKTMFSPVLVKANLEKELDSDKNMLEETENYTFSLEKNSFITADWKEYNGKVKAYFWDLWENENHYNVFKLDVFDNNWNQVWDSFTTFGMPYVKFFDENGNELKTKKWVSGSWFIQNQHKAPNIDLKNVPKNVWLGKEEMDEYNIPPFWILTDRWVWVESKAKILDEKWNYEFIYDTKL